MGPEDCARSLNELLKVEPIHSSEFGFSDELQMREGGRSDKLTRYRTGSECHVYQTPDGQHVFKFIPYRCGGIGVRFLVATVARDKISLHFSRGAYADILQRLHVVAAIGGVPTEIVGASPSGTIVVKQPMGWGEVDGQAHAEALVTARVEELPSHLLAFPSQVRQPVYLAVVEQENYLLTDLRLANMVKDSRNIARIVDALVARVTQPDPVDLRPSCGILFPGRGECLGTTETKERLKQA